MRRRRKTALRHGATATPNAGEAAAEAILGDYPGHVARDVDVRRAALELASARLRVGAAALNSARVCQVDPNSVVAFELNHIDDLLADIVRALPYAVEAVERRALRYEREARGLYRQAFLRAVAAAGGGAE